MSGLLFLTTEDFVLSRGTKGNILCTNIPGFSLILFYSTQFVHCQNLIPIFKKLPGTIGGASFGLINIGANKDIIKLSKSTIAPLQFVPYIVLYISGKPYLRYNGAHDLNELRRFVIEVAQNVESKQKFSQQKNIVIKEDPKGRIPSYTIGHPVVGCDENVCYLEFKEAYPAR